MKPYFGLGVNAAFEDVEALCRRLDESSCMSDALEAYSAERGPEAAALTQLSRSFDRGGLAAFATFILPLILDGIFHSLAPRFFAPNTLAMLQKPELSFGAVRRRKRQDRALQLAILAATATAATQATLAALRLAVRLPPIASAAPLGALAAAAALGLFRRLGARRDVADVLAMQEKGLEGEITEPTPSTPAPASA